MDIVVHGTKGGRQIFTPKKLGGLLDVNSDASKASAIGKEAYAVRFIDKTIIFSKYKIIRDVRGDKRTGFLAFSLFLPNNKKLRGSDIISVLNKVSEEYCKKYIPENDNNLRDVREDWTFLDRISDEYKTRLLPVAADDIENLPSGTKDDAYIYYKDNEELQKYFDAPHQSKYSPYRQVLFVKEELRDKPESPLNALRHSENSNDDLTGKIDLDKKVYTLRDYDGQAKNGISIEIRVGGKLLYKNDKISNKDLISIRYFRKYFNDLIVKEGRLNDESIRKYLTPDEDNRKVDVEKNINLDPLRKTITFTLRDWEKKDVYGANIFCKNASGEILIKNHNQATFEGDDLGKRWWVSASNDLFFSEEKPIDFEKYCPGDTGYIDIFLNKHRLNKQQVIVLDENDSVILNDFNLSKTEFTGNDIKETHRITVACFGYESKTFTYCPATTFYLEPIKLKKKQYGGGSKSINPEIGSPDTYDSFKRDRHISKREKKPPFYKGSKFIAGAIVGFLIIVISVGIWFADGEKEDIQVAQPVQDEYQYIQNYIEGNSLILDTLIGYKNIKLNGESNISSGLDSAIIKRMAINSWDFSVLSKLYYYPNQKKFITTIAGIDSSKYKIVKTRLGDVSTWTLNRIADSIKAVLNTPKTSAESLPGLIKDEDGKNDEPNDDLKPPNPKSAAASSASNKDKTAEIIQYLKGDELKKEVLNKYLNEAGNNTAIKKSINLCLSLWNLNGQKNNDYCTLYEKCKMDNNLKATNITQILKTLCDKTGVNYAGLANATDILLNLKKKR